MKPRILVYLPIEIKVRDFDPRLYLGLNLIRAGYDVIIGSKSVLNKQVLKIKSPFIYFSKGFQPKEQPFFSQFKDNNGRLVYLDEEGGFYKKHWDVFLWRSHDDILKFVDLYFAWGSLIKEVLLNNKSNISSDKIAVSGHPRFDMRKPEFNSFYNELRNRISEKEYILFNCAFGLGNEILTEELDYEGLKKYRKELFQEYFDELDFERSYHYQKLIFSYWIEAIQVVASQFPNVNLIVRPHPSESLFPYKQKLKDISNVQITNEGSVHEWIVNAKVIIHHDCTTAVEAMINEKKIISFAPVYRDDLATWAPATVGKRVTEIEELVTEIHDLLNSVTDNIEYSKNYNVLKPLLHNIDTYSTTTIIEEVNIRFGELQKYLPRQSFLINNNYEEAKTTLNNKIFSFIRGINRSYNKNSIYEKRRKHKMPGIERPEINYRIDLLKNIIDLPELTVEELEKDLYFIGEKRS